MPLEEGEKVACAEGARSLAGEAWSLKDHRVVLNALCVMASKIIQCDLVCLILSEASHCLPVP